MSFVFPGATNSRFQHLEIANAGSGVSLLTNVVANGQLRSPEAVTSTVLGGGHTLTAAGLDVDNLILDNVLLTSTGGTITKVAYVTFQNYATGATQLTVSHSGVGGPFTFNNLRFLTTPTTGFYVSATDTAPADGSILHLNPVCSQPLDGSARTVLAEGALVDWVGCATDTRTPTRRTRRL